MCGRYSLAAPDPSRLRARFPIGESVEVRRRFNVAPGDDVLAVTTDREGAPRGDVLRWGLVPYWAEDPKTLGLKLINARSETMAEKASFRDAVARRRCLVIADGFYEFTRADDPKQKLKNRWLFRPADDTPFAIAGIVRDSPGIGEAFTLLTVPPGPDIAPFHDRQIALLSPPQWRAWLDGSASSKEMLQPAPAGGLLVKAAA